MATKAPQSPTVLLVDGDMIAFQIAAAIEETVPLAHPTGGEILYLNSDPEEGIAKVDDYLETLMEDLDADKVVIALSDDRDNWRKHILPSYKGNRKDKRKPMALPWMRQHILDVYESYLRPGLEGDDILGILLTHPKIVSGKKICVSGDKDMKTLPGLHADLKDRDIFEVDEDTADYWHMYQTLTGDTTDGYCGCPGIGPKNAERILSPLIGNKDDMWTAVLEQFAKKHLGLEEALVQARVARILRHTDYNFKRKEVLLWTP